MAIDDPYYALQPRTTKFFKHRPHPRQAVFLMLALDHTLMRNDAIEILFGGAAGGGKSDALLDAALQLKDVPGHASLILRRTTTELNIQEAILQRAKEWLAPFMMTGEVTYSAENRRFHFHNKWLAPPATVTFGFLRDDRDLGRYQSAAFQDIIFDELTEFEDTQYTEMAARCRKTDAQDYWARKVLGTNCPLRILSGTNPGGVGHEFVLERFFTNREQNGTIFVPSKVEDNPSIHLESYLQMLAKLGPVRAAQLRHGDWNVRAKGTMFEPSWIEIVDEVPSDLRTKRYYDMAATSDRERGRKKDPDWTVGTRGGWYRGQLFVVHQGAIRSEPPGVEDFVRATALADGRSVPIHIEQEPGSGSKNLISTYQRHVLPGFAIFAHLKQQNKIAMAVPLSALAKAGNVKFLRGPWNRPLLDELSVFPTRVKGIHDDRVDSLSGLLYVCTGANMHQTIITELGL